MVIDVANGIRLCGILLLKKGHHFNKLADTDIIKLKKAVLCGSISHDSTLTT